MQWAIFGGAIVLLAILTGRGSELASALRGETTGTLFGFQAPIANPGGAGGAAGLGDVSTASSAMQAAVKPSYTSQAPVASPTYATPAYAYMPAPSPPPPSGCIGYFYEGVVTQQPQQPVVGPARPIIAVSAAPYQPPGQPLPSNLIPGRPTSTTRSF